MSTLSPSRPTHRADATLVRLRLDRRVDRAVTVIVAAGWGALAGADQGST